MLAPIHTPSKLNFSLPCAQSNIPHSIMKPFAQTLQEVQTSRHIAVPSFDTFALRRTNSDSLLSLPRVRPSLIYPAPSRQNLLALPYRARKEEYNEEAAEQFAARIVSAVNDAATCILISIGHHLGLFAVLRRLSGRAHSADIIANAARHLHVRYVQEWLSSMACVSIVEEEVIATGMPGQVVRKYRLPPEHAVFLTWGEESNMALVSQYVPILGRLEDAVVGCFRSGQGLDVARYAHFTSVASLDALQTLGAEDGVRILSHVKGLTRELEEGACVLCIGGAGDRIYICLARRFPRSWFTCYDPSMMQIKASRSMLEEAESVSNLHFRTLPEGLHTIQERRSYDVALVLDGSWVRNATRPVEVLRAISRALRREQPMVMVETAASGELVGDRGHAAGAFLYGVSAMYSLPSCLGLGGGIGGEDPIGGVWGTGRVRRALEEGGFEQVEEFEQGDGLNCVFVGKASGNDLE